MVNNDKRAVMPGGFGAGVGAAVVMMLVMAVLRFTTNTITIPELMEESLIRLTGGRVEAFFINHDSYVPQVAEEDQISKSELFSCRRGRHGRPVRTGRPALKTQANVLKGAPDEAGAIEFIRAGAIETIRRPEMRLHCRHQRLVETTG